MIEDTKHHQDTEEDGASPRGTGGSEHGLACPECGSDQVVRDPRRGELSCANCGLVLQENEIDPGPEWRAFNAADRDKKARTGPPTTELRHDRGLGSQIAYTGDSVDATTRQRFHRLRRYHQRATYQPGADRNLVRALSEIQRLTTALSLPETVAKTAARTFREAKKRDFLHGRSIEATAAATVYAAARIHEAPRLLDDIVEQANSEHRDIARTYRRLIGDLELPVPTTQPRDLIPQIASDLDLPEPVRVRAAAMIEDADDEATVGKNPAGVAAAALYLSALGTADQVIQDEVASSAGVTAVTIRARIGDLDPAL